MAVGFGVPELLCGGAFSGGHEMLVTQRSLLIDLIVLETWGSFLQSPFVAGLTGGGSGIQQRAGPCLLHCTPRECGDMAGSASGPS